MMGALVGGWEVLPGTAVGRTLLEADGGTAEDRSRADKVEGPRDGDVPVRSGRGITWVIMGPATGVPL